MRKLLKTMFFIGMFSCSTVLLAGPPTNGPGGGTMMGPPPQKQGLNVAISDVTINIPSINEISVSGDPQLLMVGVPDAGSGPAAVTDTSTSYAISSNTANASQGETITASVDNDLPSGVTLSVNLTAPTGATSSGLTALSTVDATLVSGISTNVQQSLLTIGYELDTTISAVPVSGLVEVVTFTLSS